MTFCENGQVHRALLWLYPMECVRRRWDVRLRPSDFAATNRSARGAGRLYKRAGGGKEYPADNPINAPYWLAYVIPNPTGGRGQCVRVALHDERGNPITDRKQAEAERKRIVAPYQTGNEIETLKAIQSRLQDAEARHVLPNMAEKYRRELFALDDALKVSPDTLAAMEDAYSEAYLLPTGWTPGVEDEMENVHRRMIAGATDRTALLRDTTEGLHVVRVAELLMRLRAAINAFCIECMGYDATEVRICTAPACPLYPYRPGHRKGASA